MKKKRRSKWKKSKYVTIIILILAIVETVMIFAGTYLQKRSSNNLQTAYNNQINYSTLAIDLKNTSDYLTNEVRGFAVTADMTHFQNYWNEAKQKMSREQIIQQIQASDITNSEKRYLERAKYFSDILMHIEISSMRLVLESEHITEDDVTDDFEQACIADVLIYPLENDYQVPQEEKMKEASIILYGDAYEVYKNLIDQNIRKFQSEMNHRLNMVVETAEKSARQVFVLQIFLGVAQIAILIIVFILLENWYIQPIIRYKKTIERQHGRRRMFVTPEGVWELQQFAEEFNALSSDMLNQLAKSEKIEHELIDAKAQAEKASQVKSQFLSQMSHELRTPLNTISGYLFLLEDTKMSGEQRHYTENMRQATDILLEEINEILDYSKLESGQMVFENKSFNLRHLIENLQSILENEAEQRKLAFEIQVDPDIPQYICGDPLKLKQVLTNLLYNAFKFTKEGSVTLKVYGLKFSKKGCVLEFSVEDTGIGIKKEQQQTIFRAFTQADESITRKYGGTGLGLPICRKIVQEMSHGQYTLLLESKEGKGSRFYFDMEFAYGQEEKKKEISKRSDKQKKRKLSILIVDDNRVNLILEAELLHKFGYMAEVEDHAENVIKRLEEKHYDIVFLDISMPKISGYELSMQIREKKQWEDLILVALTANIGEEVKQKVKEAKMDAYLPKPIPVEDLKTLLETYTNEIVTLKKEIILTEDNQLIAFHQLEKQLYEDRSAVKELLMLFVEDNIDFEQRIMEAVKDEKWDTLEMEFHRIKGVSGNLLCRPLEASARICLEDVKKEKWHMDHWQQFSILFEQTMDAIEKYRKEV